MSQYLMLPINKAKNNASINTPAYFAFTEAKYGKGKGFNHYGTDLISLDTNDRSVRSLGTGKVIAVGWDKACGNVVAILYPEAYNHIKKVFKDVNIRMFHLASVLVKEGDDVTAKTKIGFYGCSGSYGGTGPHLHIEADYDTDPKYALYTPTVTNSNFLVGTKQGAYAFTDPKNTVFNVVELLHRKTSAPDNQTYTTALDDGIRAEDKIIPVWPEPAQKSPAEITVDNAMADGVLTDRTYWLGVLAGTLKPEPEKIKSLFDKYHLAIKN